MSRSTKKPYYTDQQRSKISKELKRKANKRVRKEDNVPNVSGYKRLSESWDINDYSFHSPKDKKAYRK
jgi:hypothetical protein